MIVVGIDRPHYPSVEFFKDEDIDKAEATYLQLLKEHDGNDAEYICAVFISKVIKFENIKTYY